jgi:hypothetical protein
MKHRLLRLTQIIVGILLLAVMLLGAVGDRGAVAAPAAAAPQAETQGGVISARSDNPAWKAATRPWTKERMLAAIPKDMPTLEGEPAMSIEVTAAEGISGAFPSALPGNAKQATAAFEDLDLFAPAAPLGYSYPAPFSRWKHFQAYTVFPYVTAGKFFFTQYGVDYVCSASSIGNYAVWTAGHCVHAGDGSSFGWSYDVVFVPAYKNGTAPRGVWTSPTVWTNTNWYSFGDFRYDMGGAILYTNGAGQKISQVVGNLGFRYGQSVNQHWIDLGWPQASPFNGLLMHICAASYAYSDASMGTPYPTGIGCDLTGGSSGGPWIMKFSPNAGPTNYLNGHNDYRYTVHPLEMFTPYFGGAAYSLWQALIADTP